MTAEQAITDDAHLAFVMREIRESIAKQIKNADMCEELLRKLPPHHRERATINAGWMNFYNCSHDEAIEIMRDLSLGKWDRKLNTSHGDRVDYETHYKGLPIVIWAAAPPASCRIIEETVEVPAQTIVKRRLICSHDAAN